MASRGLVANPTRRAGATAIFAPLDVKIVVPGTKKAKSFTLVMKETVTGPQVTTKHLEIYDVGKEKKSLAKHTLRMKDCTQIARTIGKKKMPCIIFSHGTGEYDIRIKAPAVRHGAFGLLPARARARHTATRQLVGAAVGGWGWAGLWGRRWRSRCGWGWVGGRLLGRRAHAADG